MENKFFRLKKIKAQVKQFAPVLFLIFSLSLIGISVSQNPLLIKTRMAFINAFIPIIDVVVEPVRWVQTGVRGMQEIFSVRERNKQLQMENYRLSGWKNIALKLAEDNAQLKKTLNYVPTHEANYLTARVLADNGGAFSKSLIVQAGSENGLEKGAVGMLPEGVLGRIVEVGKSTARLLELTDYMSRVPVMVGKHRILCILTGDNTEFPKLISVPEGATIQVGDRVVTSGHAGVYPSGLAIGIVESVENEDILVKPFATGDGLEFIRLVDFGLNDVLIQDEKCECETNE